MLVDVLRPLPALTSLDVDVFDLRSCTDRVGPLNALTRLRSLTCRSLPAAASFSELGPLLGRLTALHLPRDYRCLLRDLRDVPALSRATSLRFLELYDHDGALPHVRGLTRISTTMSLMDSLETHAGLLAACADSARSWRAWLWTSASA